MSKYYDIDSRLPSGKQRHEEPIFGRARNHQPIQDINSSFDKEVLFYLSEKVINHLADSFCAHKLITQSNYFNDFSFITAPAYKALEGFLFQIANDLNLPSSGNSNLAGSYYFDEDKIDKHIDKLMKELEEKTEKASILSKYEKQDIKERVREMKSFLRNYRHTPAHFCGESIDTIAKADMNIKVIYSVIQNTTKILLKAGLIKITDDLY